MRKRSKRLELGVAIAGVQNQGAGPQSVWAPWSQEKGRIDDNSSATEGTGFETKYREDIRLAKEIGLSIFRFSIDWSRVEPEQGHIDEQYLNYCGAILKEIQKQKMKAVVTLFHFDYPIWFEKLGAFTKRKNNIHFLNYAELVIKRFSGKVYAWVTINEPNVWVFQAYIYGLFPPGENSNVIKALRTLDNLAFSHNLIYKSAKQTDPLALVGASNNVVWFLAYNTTSLIENLFAKLFDYACNFRFLGRTAFNSDFIGVQYYSRIKLQAKRGGNIAGILQEYGATKTTGEVETSDIGWELVPQGLDHFIRKIWERYKKPIFVTELGLADQKMNDRKRCTYISRTLEIVQKAQMDNIPLLGFLIWTLTDNWEWSLGFVPKFGLFSIGDHGKRIPRRSVALVTKICREE